MSDKIDKWYQHEGLDRTHMILVQLESAFGYLKDIHPSIHNEKCLKLLKTAYNSLGNLYLEIGRWEEPNESI